MNISEHFRVKAERAYIRLLNCEGGSKEQLDIICDEESLLHLLKLEHRLFSTWQVDLNRIFNKTGHVNGLIDEITRLKSIRNLTTT